MRAFGESETLPTGEGVTSRCRMTTPRPRLAARSGCAASPGDS
nr:hypothetical protein JVH1_2325 [Rhodococcus sp. JVH1]